MGYKKKAFKEMKTISDYKQEIENSVKYLVDSFFNMNTFKSSMDGLASMSEQQIESFLKFVRHVDETFNMDAAADCNRYHKIPTIVAGSVYFSYFPEVTKELNLDELSTLAFFSVVEPISFYEHAVDTVGKEVLSTVINKTPNYLERMHIMIVVDEQKKAGQTKEDIVKYITDSPLEQLKEECQRKTAEDIAGMGLPL